MKSPACSPLDVLQPRSGLQFPVSDSLLKKQRRALWRIGERWLLAKPVRRVTP